MSRSAQQVKGRDYRSGTRQLDKNGRCCDRGSGAKDEESERWERKEQGEKRIKLEA
jgi:hypothetical protein